MARDYYEILEINKSASTQEIKVAYRSLARRYHPDVTGDDPGATERFKEISEAYECLSDRQKRRTYDLFGHPKDEGFTFPGFEKFAAFSDLFSDFLGGPGDPTAPTPGVDSELSLEITFLEAFTGGPHTIDAFLNRPCSSCEGTRAASGATFSTCPSCDGSGKKNKFGPLPIGHGCSRCHGTGKVPSIKCPDCHGTGTRDEKSRVKVQVPAGVPNGTRLRLRGRGAAGRNGGTPGDLYVRITVKSDPRFERSEDDLHTQVRVGLDTAMVGGDIDVELPGADARMKIPAGTQGGQTFRLRGKGFKHLGRAGYGDALVTVQVRIPKQITEEERALLEKIAKRDD